jgi:hypothetical protein
VPITRQWRTARVAHFLQSTRRVFYPRLGMPGTFPGRTSGAMTDTASTRTLAQRRKFDRLPHCSKCTQPGCSTTGSAPTRWFVFPGPRSGSVARNCIAQTVPRSNGRAASATSSGAMSHAGLVQASGHVRSLRPDI